jgi:hypothetical protein
LITGAILNRLGFLSEVVLTGLPMIPFDSEIKAVLNRSVMSSGKIGAGIAALIWGLIFLPPLFRVFEVILG